MSYHPDFWVAVATAAPVIALANTVSITDAVNTWLNTKGRKRGGAATPAYFFVLLISILNFAVQALALYRALESLGEEKDQNIPGATTIVGTGLIYVLAVITYSVILKYATGQPKRPVAKHEGDNANEDGQEA